jgi:nucleolar protein 53
MQTIKQMKEKRKMEKDIEKLDVVMQQATNEAQFHRNQNKRTYRKIAEEKVLQETVGIVNKPRKIGRFKYEQRKNDFQLEEELAGSLRTIKPLGNNELIQDRFDSIFRRNLVEPDAPSNAEKFRQKKAKFKFHGKVGEVTRELDVKNKALKLRNDRNAKGIKEFINSDIITL